MARRPVQATVRGWAEYLGDSRFRYHWPCGHTRTEVLRNVLHNPMPDLACRLLARSWAKDHGGVSLPLCRTCAKKEQP